jgi:hypothetical protein
MYVSAGANGLDSRLLKNSVAWDSAFYPLRTLFRGRTKSHNYTKNLCLRALREEVYRNRGFLILIENWINLIENLISSSNRAY